MEEQDMAEFIVGHEKSARQSVFLGYDSKNRDTMKGQKKNNDTTKPPVAFVPEQWHSDSDDDEKSKAIRALSFCLTS